MEKKEKANSIKEETKNNEPLDVKKLREEFKGPHHLLETKDGKILFLREWEPDPSKKNGVAILIFHGITAYSGPYAFIGEPLAKAGFNVFGLDYRGHGLSDGIRGDYKSRRMMVDDLSLPIDYIKEKLGFKKLVLLGHSLGVAAAILISHHRLDKIDGYILLSAARRFRPEVYPSLNFLDKFKILFSAIFNPSNPVIKYRREGMLGLDDPLFNFNYTFRFMRLIDPRKLKAPEGLNVPVLVAVGDRDELFEVDAVKELFNEVPSKDKEFHVIERAKHAVFPKSVIDILLDWLNRKFIEK
ncbi:MAG: alpha/beta hydrolase [Promethearchaeota archaeon]